MIRAWLLALCLVAGASRASEPLLQAQAQLLPGDRALVGQTVTLQVDVLTDTWFSSAPQLPRLTLPGALVLPPGEQAQHLTLHQQGKTLFGMRYRYQITPQQPGPLAIAALTISARPGQASAAMTATTQPLLLTASLPTGAVAGQALLVAKTISLSQTVTYSHQPLRVGDSVTRTLTLRAEGAQRLSLPAPGWVTVDGLGLYPAAAQLSDLNDGRGSSQGGQRVDSVTYRIERGGHFQLPAVTLNGWDAAGNARQAQVPAITFDASEAAAYRTVFSLPRQWPWGWLAVLAVVVSASYRQRARIGHKLAHWQARWHASPTAMRLRARHQLDEKPAQLGALYHWQRHQQHSLRLNAPEALAHCYGPHPDGQTRQLRQRLQRPLSWRWLASELSGLQKLAGKPAPTGSLPRHTSLRPLNPSHDTETS